MTPIAALLPTPYSHLTIALGLAVLLSTSGRVVWRVLTSVHPMPPAPPKPAATDQPAHAEAVEQQRKQRDTGMIIGKCENILILLFVLTGEYTAMAIVFTAKAIVRQEDIRKDSLFFLAGTLVNVTYSVAIALLTKLALHRGDVASLLTGS